MPLARFALYESGVEIYVASTADDGDAWQATLVHIARSRVPSSSPRPTSSERRAYPEDFPLLRLVEDIGTIGRGGSAILAPGGGYLAARSTTTRGSSTPSSTRPCSGPSGSGSTPQATTTGRTCSRSPSRRIE